jgi:hypothetical protein
MDDDTVCFAYSSTESAIFSLQSLAATDVPVPSSSTSNVAGRSGLTGLAGYMTLGLGAKAKPGDW